MRKLYVFSDREENNYIFMLEDMNKSRENYNYDVMMKLFTVRTNNQEEPCPPCSSCTEFHFEGAFYHVKFDFNEILKKALELINYHSCIDDMKKFKQFIVNFIRCSRCELVD